MTIIPYRMDDIIRNSYKDFHAKGFDYLCLHRELKNTIKVYILDGDITKVPEVINPHNHRYAFRTEVLVGGLIDHQYMPSTHGVVFKRYNYLTPLNGGEGFSEDSLQTLLQYKQVKMDRKGDYLHSPSHRIHTIQMLRDQTMLLLEQYEDEIPIGTPTQCWVREKEPKPNTSGLYSKFTPDEIKKRLEDISVNSDMVFHEITS